MNSVSEYLIFIRQAHRSFHTTGAIAPSGSALGRAAASQIQRAGGPLRVLEVGAGTGALTKQIVQHIGPRDHLDVVEVNEQFLRVLKNRFEQDTPFQRMADRMRILHMPIQDLRVQEPYDFIISGLPLNNFPASLVRDTFGVFVRLLAPRGVLSFYEYLWIRRFKRVVAPEHERRRLTQVGQVIEGYLKRYEFRRDTILTNLPPARVHHLRLKG